MEYEVIATVRVVVEASSVEEARLKADDLLGNVALWVDIDEVIED